MLVLCLNIFFVRLFSIEVRVVIIEQISSIVGVMLRWVYMLQVQEIIVVVSKLLKKFCQVLFGEIFGVSLCLLNILLNIQVLEFVFYIRIMMYSSYSVLLQWLLVQCQVCSVSMFQKNGMMVRMLKMRCSILEWCQNVVDVGYESISSNVMIYQVKEVYSDFLIIG